MPIVEDPNIEALQLRETARQAAYALKQSHPRVIFTSGRRDKARQCHAMAENVAQPQHRNYIRNTYAPNVASAACQQWVDAHPEAITVDQIAAGLVGVLDGLSDNDVAHLSRHLSGDAFDVQPVLPDVDGIMVTIRNLPGVRFLEREDGLERWHAEFINAT